MHCCLKFLQMKGPERCLYLRHLSRLFVELRRKTDQRNKIKKPAAPGLLSDSSGAEGGTRTRTDCSTRPSNVRGYQLRHLGLIGSGRRPLPLKRSITYSPPTSLATGQV